MADNFEGVRLVAPGAPESAAPKEKTTETETPAVETTSPVIDLGGGEEISSLFNKTPESGDTIDTPDETSTEDNVYSALVKELADRGLVELPEDTKIESADDILSIFDNSINGKVEETVEEFKRSFSGAKKIFLEIEDAFDDEYQAMKVSQELDYYGRLTTDVLKQNTNVQKDIYQRYLQMKGLSQKEVFEAVEEAEALAKLEEKAAYALPQLKQSATQFIEEKKALKDAEKQRYEKRTAEQFENLLKGTDEIEELIPGIQLTARHKTAIKEGMSKIAYTDPETGAQFTELGYKQYSNPEGFERLIQFYNSLGMFNLTEKGEFKPDLNKMVKLTEKQVKRKLDELIREQQQTSTPGSKSSAGTKLNISFWDDAFGDK